MHPTSVIEPGSNGTREPDTTLTSAAHHLGRAFCGEDLIATFDLNLCGVER